MNESDHINGLESTQSRIGLFFYFSYQKHQKPFLRFCFQNTFVTYNKTYIHFDHSCQEFSFIQTSMHIYYMSNIEHNQRLQNSSQIKQNKYPDNPKLSTDIQQENIQNSQSSSFEMSLEENENTQEETKEQKRVLSQSESQIKNKIIQGHEGQPSKLNNNNLKSGSIIICIEDSESIPTVYLQSSPKGKKCISVKIPMYKTTTFMKMETQIFILDVTKPGTSKDYQIQRRYSDFVQLFQALFYNHPGFILAPFPDKGFQTFIKIKLGIGTNQPGQRCQMIEKRMLDLEKFINFVTHHSELSNSEQLANFLEENCSKFQQGQKRFEKYISETKSLQKSSQLKNLYEIGKSLWTYVKNEQKSRQILSIGKNDIDFSVIFQSVKAEKGKLLDKRNLYTQLAQAEKNFASFTDFPTENDTLLKLCAKHSSSRQYSNSFANFIQYTIIQECQYIYRKYQSIEKVLMYRIEVSQNLEQAKKDRNTERKQKLSRRIQMLERNFFSDWENSFFDIGKQLQILHQKFVDQWNKYKNLMSKVWKSTKKI